MVQESDTEEEEKRKEQLPGESSQPKQRAMPMNPPALRLTPKMETESDNYRDNRAPLSRRPTMTAPPPCNLEFFFCFSFTHFAVEIDLLEFVELGEIVRTEDFHPS